MKKLLMLVLAGSALSLFLAGCNSTGKKFSKEEKELLKSNKDIVISGVTGEIKGTNADKNPKTAICKNCGFPKGSLRQWILISSEFEMDEQTRKKLRDKSDVVLSGKTGALKDTVKDKEPNKVKCDDCGFPEGSLRQRVIIYEEP